MLKKGQKGSNWGKGLDPDSDRGHFDASLEGPDPLDLGFG